jgi:hypothetical protein
MTRFLKMIKSLKVSVIFQVGDSLGNSFSYPSHAETWS